MTYRLVGILRQLIGCQSAHRNHSIEHWKAIQSSTIVRWKFLLLPLCNIETELHERKPTHSSQYYCFDRSSLESNQLSGTIPSSIGLLTNLQYLYDNDQCVHWWITNSFEYQDIHPVSWCHHDRLLDGNQFMGTIPTTFASLTNLQFLYETLTFSLNETVTHYSCIL